MRYLILLLVCASFAVAASDPTAESLAKAAEQARSSGQLVRAYMLYAEAAAREPKSEKYRSNRDGLEPLAKLLSKSGIEKEPSREELLASVPDEVDEPLPKVGRQEFQLEQKLKPPPELSLLPGRHSFHTKTDERNLYETVARAYGIGVVFDPEIQPQASVTLDLDDVDAKQALEGVAEATDTFLFPISSTAIFVARDTPEKRQEYEPQVVLTVPMPDVADPKDMTEAGNAVRQAFNLRYIGVDSEDRSIVLRDRLSQANAARSLLETLIRPAPQVAIEVQILTVDDQRALDYGLSLPNTFPLINLGAMFTSNLQVAIPQAFINFLTFGGGRTLFGIGVMNAEAVATYSKSVAKSIYDATVVVSSGQTAQWHVGDKFPIATTLSNGAQAIGNPLATYVANIQMVDLGLLLKVKPDLHPDGDISMDLHAEYQALGSQTYNTVPSILNRQFEGSVRLHEGEWAILAGLNTQSSVRTKTGIAGLSSIPLVGNLFSEINKTQTGSHTLVVVKPHPLSLLPVEDKTPVYVGGEYGRKVLL
ncbi:MAG TPA: type II and III secretion system protein [Bryobacteraceae bacterium]|nr:type II and III secretion system protein [Bryobacteraceae bacterium]